MSQLAVSWFVTIISYRGFILCQLKDVALFVINVSFCVN